ncbi:Transmembrane protein 69 [Varanus komodoensis]|nr:transmembrane protein 69 isoform X2 [Varanus komodoensis]XP_044297732.1 transmembrane protein 69 isoform X2 [Varanus komodoensis]KAF7254758.1 Transmembrane protein 69 [Varanus komodoensis]
MYHLLQRCSLQIPSKILHFQRLSQPGRCKVVHYLLPIECGQVALPKLEWLKQTSGTIIKAQYFHSSCCRWKKQKKPEEPEPRQLGLVRYDMPSLKDSPKPALYLSFAGLIPFVSIPLLMVINEVFYSELVFAHIAYGACIVSFLGGIRWGFALPEGSPAKPDWINLANSVVSPFLAWLALLFYQDPTQAAAMVIIGLGIALHYDLALLPTYPSWFKALRTVLTVVAAGSLFTIIFIVNNYPEKSLSKIVSEMKQLK